MKVTKKHKLYRVEWDESPGHRMSKGGFSSLAEAREYATQFSPQRHVKISTYRSKFKARNAKSRWQRAEEAAHSLARRIAEKFR